MPDPIALPGSSPRHLLPFLYPGQAQKEQFVNESLCRLDLLLHPAVAGTATVPPPDSQEGACWLIGPGASGAWSGKVNQIAGYCAGSWLYCAPKPGMRLWDSSANRSLVFTDSWEAQAAPAAPTGGAVVDSQARAALAALIGALTDSGILSPT